MSFILDNYGLAEINGSLLRLRATEKLNLYCIAILLTMMLICLFFYTTVLTKVINIICMTKQAAQIVQLCK